MSSINFDNPWLLLIAVPLVALFLVPFFIAIRKENTSGNNVASCVMHVLMAIIIAFVAAGTTIITTVTQTDIYVVADVSYSANRNLDVVDGYIRELGSNLPDNSRMGVVCFGRDCKLVTRLGERFKTVKDAGIDDSSTNIVDALDFTGSLFRDDVIKRIVLITDGRSTDGTDANALKRQVNALTDKKIHVDAIYLDDNMAGDATEVQLSSVSYTQTACLGRDESASVTVQCNCPDGVEMDVIIKLYKDGEEYSTETPVLVKGNNVVSFGLDTSAAGSYDYTAEIIAEGDLNANNNKTSFTQTVSDDMKVLLVAKSLSDYNALNEIYGESAEITPYIGSTGVPCSVEELCAYDQIVFSDVDVSALDNYEMLMQSLDTVVSLFGKSFITFGNTYIQSHGDGKLNRLSDMLPVVYGKSESDPKLYTLVIDTSRSMEWNGKLDRAKSAAKEIVDLLSGEDRLGIVEFNGDSFIAHSIVPVSTNYDSIMKAIDDLKVRQGTIIGSGLNMAYKMMSQGQYSEKRCMLISDGLNFSAGDDPLATVQEMSDNSIYTSVLDVGRSADGDVAATQGLILLKNIVATGGGAYLDITTEENLQSVITNELPADVNQFGGYSNVGVNRRKDGVMNGLNESALTASFVRNYIISTAKTNAYTPLTAQYTVNENTGYTKNAPLYSYWKYGNGRTASFTSTLSGDWVSSIDGKLRNKLFENILDTNVPAEKVNYPFLLSVITEEGVARVNLTPSTVRYGAEAKAEVISPDGSVKQGDMAFGTSAYDYSFVTPSEGKYTVNVSLSYGGRTFAATRTVYVSYSAEYDSFALYDASSLHKAIGANGVVSENGKLEIVNDDREVGLYEMSLAIPLLIACVILYAVDIAVRKLKWSDIKSLFKRVKK